MRDLSPYSFPSVQRTASLSDRVADELTGAIVSKRIRPGDLLPSERELGDRFKVSRTVVREAVRSLVARGLVRVTSGRGVEVRGFGPESVAASMGPLVRGFDLGYREVNEVRMPVEVQIAGLAAERAQPADLERLKQICDEHERALEKPDLNAASELDFQFHRELTCCAGNPLLLVVVDSFAAVLRQVRSQAIADDPDVGHKGLRAHRQILECLMDRRANDARKAMTEHLEEAKRFWLEVTPNTKARARKKKPTKKPARRRDQQQSRPR